MGHIDQKLEFRSIFAVDWLTGWSWLVLPLAVSSTKSARYWDLPLAYQLVTAA
jgi:hypothetical protein